MGFLLTIVSPDVPPNSAVVGNTAVIVAVLPSEAMTGVPVIVAPFTVKGPAPVKVKVFPSLVRVIVAVYVVFGAHLSVPGLVIAGNHDIAPVY